MSEMVSIEDIQDVFDGFEIVDCAVEHSKRFYFIGFESNVLALAAELHAFRFRHCRRTSLPK